MSDHGTTISAEPDDDEFDPPLIPGTIMWALYEIRRSIGDDTGKIMLHDLPDAVDAALTAAVEAERAACVAIAREKARIDDDGTLSTRALAIADAIAARKGNAMTSNNPPYAIVEFTQDEYEMLLQNCNTAIRLGLGVISDNKTPEALARKVVALMEKYRSVKQALERAKI